MSKVPVKSDAQVLGDVGENTVKLILTKFGWTADLIKSDFGEDIDCNIFIDNLRTNYYLRCQVKSTKNKSDYIKILKNGDYSVKINSGLLRAWISSYFPVFLIVYDQDKDLCYWTLPVKEILKTPSRLDKKEPVIHVSKKNIFNHKAKDIILNKVLAFYSKILRLNESIIECKITPVLMPGYRVIPFYHFSEFLNKQNPLESKTSGDYLELLPSWMTVLRRLEPLDFSSSIRLHSKNTNLKIFLSHLKEQLKSFNYSTKNNEWISFIVSPIKIVSKDSLWINELTYWSCYSKFNNDSFVADYEYNFELPGGFLKPINRRSQSWDYYLSVNPQKDIAIQFLGGLEIISPLKNIVDIHYKNITGNLLLWECTQNEMVEISKHIKNLPLTIQVISEENDNCFIAITTPLFNPFLGLFSLAQDWESYENGNVRQLLKKNKLHEILPGNEYKGEIPDDLKELLERKPKEIDSKHVVHQLGYRTGLPLLHNERQVQISRFQMLNEKLVKEVSNIINSNKLIINNKYKIEFHQIDDSWKFPIYELSLSWAPDLYNSSINDYLNSEKEILHLINSILPTSSDESIQLKNTYEILHIAGLIGFEKNENE